MKKSGKRLTNAPSPEDIPPSQLSALSKRYLDWKMGMVVVVGVLLVFTFINTFVTNPTVSGYAVVDAQTQDTERFTGMSSLLVVIFAFFALFLFMVIKRSGGTKRR